MRSLELEMSYRPMPKQIQFHGLTAKYRSFVGGWGNGKTSAGCVETITSLLEYPGTNCIVSRKTRPELRATSWDMLLNGDTSQPHSWHGIPKQLISYKRDSDLYLKLINGSQIHGLPLDDPKKIENYNLGFFWIDQAEEIEEDIFLKFHGRLRQMNAPREGVLTWNPNGHNWLWRRFIDPNRPEKWRTRYKAIEATTYDNPNLPEDYLEQFDGLPDAWLQRFLMGSHDVFVGQIFTDWDPDVHVIEPFRIPPEWERTMCIDPGIRHEAALSWIARDPQGNCYYYREYLRPSDVDHLATQIFHHEVQHDIGGPQEAIWRRFIGPEARIRAQTDGKTVLDLFYEKGVYPEIADRDPSARISKITEYLRPRDGHRNPQTGAEPAPRLYVFANCAKLVEYLPQYRWRPQRVNYSEEDAPEKPRKKDDHNIDNLGHLLVALDSLPPMEGDSPVLSPERRVVKELLDESYEQAQQPEDVLVHPVLGSDY